MAVRRRKGQTVAAVVLRIISGKSSELHKTETFFFGVMQKALLFTFFLFTPEIRLMSIKSHD